jgi:hypothetical protein
LNQVDLKQADLNQVDLKTGGTSALGRGTVGHKGGSEPADTMQELAQRLRGWGGKRFCRRSVAEALFFHLFCGGSEAFGTRIIHGQETEGLRERHTIGASLKEFDMSADFAENRTHSDLTHGPARNRTFGEDGRTSGERKALKDSNKTDIVDGK